MKGLRLKFESPDERRLIAFHFKALGIVYYPPLDAWVLQEELDSKGKAPHTEE